MPIFEGLSAADMIGAAEVAEEAELPAGAELFRQGDAGDALYVLLHGRVRVERAGRTLAEIGPPECVGEMALLDDEPRSATVTAVEDCALLRIDAEDFADLLADAPEVLRGVVRVLLRRLRARAP